MVNPLFPLNWHTMCCCPNTVKWQPIFWDDMFIIRHGGRCLLAGANNSKTRIVIKQIEKGVLKHYGKALIESGLGWTLFRQMFWETDVLGGKEEMGRSRDHKQKAPRPPPSTHGIICLSLVCFWQTFQTKNWSNERALGFFLSPGNRVGNRLKKAGKGVKFSNREFNISSGKIFICLAKSEAPARLKRSDRSNMVFDAGKLTAASSERWLSWRHCQLGLISTFSLYVTVPVLQLTPNHVPLSFLWMDQEEMSWK